jgi:hypothetical protein
MQTGGTGVDATNMRRIDLRNLADRCNSRRLQSPANLRIGEEGGNAIIECKSSCRVFPSPESGACFERAAALARLAGLGKDTKSGVSLPLHIRWVVAPHGSDQACAKTRGGTDANRWRVCDNRPDLTCCVGRTRRLSAAPDRPPLFGATP